MKKIYFRSSQQTGYENGFNDERKRISLGQKSQTCHSHTKVYAARLSVRAADDHCRHKNMKSCEVRSSFKRCFTRSLIDTIWWHLQLIFKLTLADISCKITQSKFKNYAKHCFNINHV